MHNRGHARTVRRRVGAQQRRRMMNELCELALQQGRPRRARKDRRRVAADGRRQRRRRATAVALLGERNAGGSSGISEALSLEWMMSKFGAVLVETESEMQVKAGPNIPLLDYTVDVTGQSVGVSVTRAMAPPHAPERGFELRDAHVLLCKKLAGLRNARGAWDRRVLHVWAESERVQRLVCEAAAALRGDMPRDACVVVSLAPSSRALFDEGKGALSSGSRAADPDGSLPPEVRRSLGLTRRVRGSPQAAGPNHSLPPGILRSLGLTRRVRGSR